MKNTWKSIGAITAANLDPVWYGWTLVVIALPIAWLGGKWYEKTAQSKKIFEY